MSTERTTYHVVYDAAKDNWRVEKQGASRAVAVCATREDAIGRADELARKQMPSQVDAEQEGSRVKEKSLYDAA